MAKAILGAIAAVGVARLLAPKETTEMMETAKRAVARGVTRAKRTASAAVDEAEAMGMPRTKAASRTSARKSSRPRTARKAAKRPRKTAS
jgi:hypothetical protein